MPASRTNTIILLDSDDDDIPSASPFAAGSNRQSSSVPAAGSNLQSMGSSEILIPRNVTAVGMDAVASRRRLHAGGVSQRPAKKKKLEMPHCVIWVCTHGKGQSKNWRQKDLKIAGAYSSKEAATTAKHEVMQRHECCGHGDILVGGCWDDEIDLVVREAPMFLDGVSQRPAKKKKSEMPHCVIWVCTHGKGQSKNWRQKDLKIVGVYSSKEAATTAKHEVMQQHECCGHGDILVGGCWDDEIDLVVREAPMFLDGEE